MPSSATDKTKDWQMELLMEKLRSKSSQCKSFPEISKNVRMAMLDKRYALDSVEKSQHQKCLDTLQHCIKVTSLQSMVERLESLTRQLGLKFMVGPSAVELFISSDMFYLEVILDQSGAVRDVKVHHEGKMEQSCSELLNCLSRQDFDDFTAQLEGFASIYQLNAEKKIKSKAFTALQSLETDLSTLAQLQTFMKEPFNLVHKSPVGILEKRRGGHPMKLTYFVSPYDLLNIEREELEPMAVEMIISKKLGYSVTVCMEGSATHKLQTTSLITVNRNINGKSTPSFAALSPQNSAVIPACFILKLNKPMPMCVALVKQLQQLTELECADTSVTHPLLSLIVTHHSDGKMDTANNRGLFVTLPDQHHCYFMTENKNMDGILVNSIPFTHPGHVSQILVILRQQALFNSIVTSCVRPNSKQDFENMIMFEISALSWTHISISLEHPIEETMATAEIDLSDISNLHCRVHSPSSPPPPSTPDVASELAIKALNRSFSIPVTMRAITKLWDKQVVRKNHFNGHENFSLPLGSGDPGGPKGPPGGGLADFGGLDRKIKQEPMGNGSGLGHGMNLNISMMGNANADMFLNDSLTGYESTSVFSNVELTNILTGSDKSAKKHGKRKPSEDGWKSSKRKQTDDTDMLIESSSSDSTSRSTPVSQETASELETNTPVGFQSDLELSALDPAELISSGDKSNSEYENVDEEVVSVLISGGKDHRQSRKTREIDRSPSATDLIDKSLVPPNVSITPITSPYSSTSTIANERKSGIEIIPINTPPQTSVPSSITITPILTSHSKSGEEKRQKKYSKNKSDDKSKLEKKRKRKREESPMGPPEKIPNKQDSINKPISVSIKPAESPPLRPITPTSPSSIVRKFSPSPTQNKTFTVSGKLSPNIMKSSGSKPSSHQSPKHSPAHVPSSPKHSFSISSPKNHGASPKHPSAGGSGKPSMSTLKSAANSPSSSGKGSGETSKSKSISKDLNRDKEKKSSSSSANAIKPKSTVKVKQLEGNNFDVTLTQQQAGDNLPSPGTSIDPNKSAISNQQMRNRKNLSQIVDKLKSAQHCDGTILSDLSKSSSSSSGNKERSSGGQTSSGKSTDSGSSNKSGGKETKNSEYMVKPSLDGMKITINKTRTKEASSKSSSGTSSSGGGGSSSAGSVVRNLSSSGTGSPKTHTGLKPGVNSGPASKKPQAFQKSTTSLSSSLSSYGTLKNSSVMNKSQQPTNAKTSSSSISSSSGGSLLKSTSSRMTGSPKTSSSTATDLSSRNKDRPKMSKSGSEKSIFSSSRDKKSSPTPNRDESDGDKALKLAFSKMDAYASPPIVVEGLIKQFDKSFQIPKLSARNSDDAKKTASSLNKVTTTTSSETTNNVNRSLDGAKMFDVLSKNDVVLPKYPLALPTTKMFDTSMETKIRNSMNVTVGSVMSSNPKTSMANSQHHHPFETSSEMSEKKGTTSSSSSSNKEDVNFKLNYPISSGKYPMSASSGSGSGGGNSEPLSLSTKSIDLSTKFATPLAKDEKRDVKGSSTECVLLDYSSAGVKCDVIKMGGGNTGSSALGPPPPYPHSPSVSVHIVKSPVASPLVVPSPLSASPCITDDELMDEALAGLGK
ncbi:mediator of RNA polymerase II transcription subunit 1 [Agrilus planipennis]|uniref:Mediator of RNA polymerase II transcription subunit 1 n=1 Tax=Agrilus planipennis TaxID=224129 RepID=A0A1W4W4H1_AGRPL|nr:mediator of RNA polymerase II transcription subunit 1 [Agrilus planipennis]